MKQQLLFLLIIGNLCFSQTGVGTTTPDASAILEVQSNTKGFLPPRMTETEMNAIIAPAEGLLLYCTDCNPKGVYVFDSAEFLSTITGYISNDPFLAILEDSASLAGANNADGIPVSLEQLQATGVTNLNMLYLADYQSAITAETGFSNPPSISEVQAIINAVNSALTVPSIIAASTNPASGGIPSIADLAFAGLTDLTETQVEYEEAIADALPVPTTLEDLQIIINAVNTDIPGNTTCATKPMSATPCTAQELANGIGLNGADGQPYEVVQIGDQCWMAENIDTGVADATNIGWSGYYDTTFQADKEGTLFQWSEAMQGATEERAQGVCPDGWHIPSDCEWMYLENTLGMSVADQQVTGSSRGTNEGTQLKPGEVTEFEALYAGTGSNGVSFSSRGTLTQYWSSSESSVNATYRRITSSITTVRRSILSKSTAISIRCVKN